MSKKEIKGHTFRKFINDIHLWLGIGSSLILFLVCLSGTIYTFRHEIEEVLEPEKFHVEVNSLAARPLGELISKTEEFTSGTVTRISYCDDPNTPYELQVSTSAEDKRGETYYINQYTSEILGTGKGPATEFFMFFFKMHRWLLLDQEIGRPIVGVATLIFVVLCISGFILWLPKKIRGFKSLKPGFKIKYNARWKRVNHDLHSTLGFYAGILLLIMALTGLNWSFEWYKDGVSSVLGAKVFGARDEQPLQSVVKGQPLALAEIIRKGDSIFPYKGNTIIGLPKGPDGSYDFKKQNDDSFNRSASDKVVFDRYSGAVLKKELFSQKSAGQKIAAQIKAIHLGEIYGTLSKLLYFVACLVATSLPVTGVFIWLNKMKKPTGRLIKQ